VASLRLVSHGAPTLGVTPFSLKNLTTCLYRHLKVMTFLAIVSSPFPPFPPSNILYPVFSINSAAKINFIRVSPSPGGMVSPGRSAHPSDATGSQNAFLTIFDPVVTLNFVNFWLQHLISSPLSPRYKFDEIHMRGF